MCKEEPILAYVWEIFVRRLNFRPGPTSMEFDFKIDLAMGYLIEAEGLDEES